VIRQVIEVIVSAGGINPIVAVTGCHAGLIAHALAGLPVKLAHNPEYARGEMLSSVQTGLREIRPYVDAVFLTLADQPLIRPETYRRLRNAWTMSMPLLAAPVFEGRRGHPIILSARAIPEVLALPWDDTLRSFTSAHASERLNVTVDDPGATLDMDTPAEYISAAERARTSNNS
jgi:CTP:molybdopterin cytidylyltransferase MocA